MSKENPTPQERFHAAHKRRFVVNCFDTTEKDIIERLEAQGSGKQAAYIKRLIRDDIKKDSR